MHTVSCRLSNEIKARNGPKFLPDCTTSPSSLFLGILPTAFTNILQTFLNNNSPAWFLERVYSTHLFFESTKNKVKTTLKLVRTCYNLNVESSASSTFLTPTDQAGWLLGLRLLLWFCARKSRPLYHQSDDDHRSVPRTSLGESSPVQL